MKHWPSQLFPVIVLLILAGLSFWLQSTVDRGETKNDGKFRHDPDATAENFTVRRIASLRRTSCTTPTTTPPK